MHNEVIFTGKCQTNTVSRCSSSMRANNNVAEVCQCQGDGRYKFQLQKSYKIANCKAFFFFCNFHARLRKSKRERKRIKL